MDGWMDGWKKSLEINETYYLFLLIKKEEEEKSFVRFFFIIFISNLV
jgi:hypothetical protein